MEKRKKLPSQDVAINLEKRIVNIFYLKREKEERKVLTGKNCFLFVKNKI